MPTCTHADHADPLDVQHVLQTVGGVSNPIAMATASTRAAPVTTMPSIRTARSLALGITAITNAPSKGNSVVIVMAEFSPRHLDFTLPLTRSG